MGKRASSIELSNEEREYLKLQTRARTIQAQTVTRARILLLRADSVSIDAIADKVGLNRCSVMLCLKKFKEGGIENALFDAPGRGRNAEITDEEKAWIINIACQKPIDFGYAAETWTYAKLTSHINKTAEAAGYTRLSTISPLYNFINDRLVDESAVLRPLSWHLILYVFRYFSRKWQKISDCECPDLIQNETPVRFLYGTQKNVRSDRAESSWHSN